MRARAQNRAGMAVLASAFLLICWADASHAVDFGALAVTVYFLDESDRRSWNGSLVGLWVVSRQAHARRSALYGAAGFQNLRMVRAGTGA